MSSGAEPETPGPTQGARRGWRHRDHTRGSLLGSLMILALPLMASSIAGGVIFQLVDLAFISRLGEEPMASVIIVNQTLRQGMMLLIMGGGFGTQALIARAVGEGRTDRAEHVAGQAVLLGALFAGSMALIGGLFPGWLFSLPGPDPAFVPYGVPYLRLVFLLCFGVVGAQLFGAILGGAGDTATPFFVLLVQLAIAITAEWILIFGNLGAPALGVRGVALGIAAGQIVALGIGLTVLFRGRSRVHLRRRHLIPDAAMMRGIVSLSWPSAIQLGSTVITTVVFLRLAGDFGANVQAAYAIGLRLSMIAPMVCFPLASACATLVGQALGSGNVPRAWRTVGVGLLVHGSVMAGLAVVVLLYRVEILALFSDDAEVIRVGSEYLHYAAGAFAMWAFYFVFLRTLQGAGDVVAPMLISLASSLLVAIPLALALTRWLAFGPTGIWIAFLTSSVFSTVATGLWLATGRWTRRAARYASGPGGA